jgi:hypothetical protein
VKGPDAGSTDHALQALKQASGRHLFQFWLQVSDVWSDVVYGRES